MNTNDIIIKCKQTLGVKGFDGELLAALNVGLKDISRELNISCTETAVFINGAADYEQLSYEPTKITAVEKCGEKIPFFCDDSNIYAGVDGLAEVTYISAPTVDERGEINATGISFYMIYTATLAAFARAKKLSTAEIFNDLYRRVLAEKKETKQTVITGLNAEFLRREKMTAHRIFTELAENHGVLVGRFDFDDLRNYANSWGVDICEED